MMEFIKVEEAEGSHESGEEIGNGMRVHVMWA